MNVLEELKLFYRDWTEEKGFIGCSENGALIPYVAVKKTEKPVILAQYAIHAREYITTYLAMMQAQDFLRNGKRGTVYFIPAVNPAFVLIFICPREVFSRIFFMAAEIFSNCKLGSPSQPCPKLIIASSA